MCKESEQDNQNSNLESGSEGVMEEANDRIRKN